MQAAYEHNEGFVGRNAESIACVHAFVGGRCAEALAINAISDLYDRFGAQAEFSLQILAAELIQNEKVLTPRRQVLPNQSGIVKCDLVSKMGVVQRKPVGAAPREHAAQSRGTSMHVDDFWLKRLQDLTQLPRALQQCFGTRPQQIRH